MTLFECIKNQSPCLLTEDFRYTPSIFHIKPDIYRQTKRKRITAENPHRTKPTTDNKNMLTKLNKTIVFVSIHCREFESHKERSKKKAPARLPRQPWQSNMIYVLPKHKEKHISLAISVQCVLFPKRDPRIQGSPFGAPTRRVFLGFPIDIKKNFAPKKAE